MSIGAQADGRDHRIGVGLQHCIDLRLNSARNVHGDEEARRTGRFDGEARAQASTKATCSSGSAAFRPRDRPAAAIWQGA